MKKIRFFFLLTTFLLRTTWAKETCSRVALINFQEILVDTSANEKGEGLRFYLEKDPIAKSYLDRYQSGTGIKWQNAVLGTLGSLLILGGFLTSDKKREQTFLVSGATIIGVNFLVAKTLDHVNEENLEKGKWPKYEVQVFAKRTAR